VVSDHTKRVLGILTLPDTMNKIIVYEHINFEGLSKEFTSNVSNLVEHFFNDTISSLKVIGNPWVAYTDINFSGSQAVYEEGEYNRVNPNDSISSLEMITDDLTNPQITLYEHSHINFEGLSKEFTSNVSNLVEHFFNDTISSLKVIGNPWVAYTDINFSGSQNKMLFLPYLSCNFDICCVVFFKTWHKIIKRMI
uniref:Beta/gamma crystallin 'Greek key' domain-containing protein n=1 Tax=Electrophorus electricus TaxID=8005 RepID=A0A4W4E0S3_ELEEL